MTTPLYAVFFSRQALADPLLLRLMTTPLYAVFFSRQGPLPGAWVVLPVVGVNVVVKFPAVVVAVGATVVGATVVGATVVGATVVGASVEKDQSQVPVSSPRAAIPNLFSLITRALSSSSLPVVWPIN